MILPTTDTPRALSDPARRLDLHPKQLRPYEVVGSPVASHRQLGVLYLLDAYEFEHGFLPNNWQDIQKIARVERGERDLLSEVLERFYQQRPDGTWAVKWPATATPGGGR